MRLMTVLVLAAAVCFFGAGCGKVSKKVDEQIEVVGTELTGEEVVVDEVDIKIGRAAGAINGLSVDNPDGYEADHAFDMDQVLVNLGLLKTLGKGHLFLDKLVIDSPVVSLQFNEDGTTNLHALADNMEANSASADEKSAEIKPKSKDEPKEPVRISIKKLVIEGVSLAVIRADGTKRVATLPAIHMADVGGKEGKTPAGLGTLIVLSIFEEGLRQAVAHRLMDGDLFTGERVMKLFESELGLSAEQREELVPVIETLCDGLNRTVETWVEEGSVDAEALGEDFAPVVAEVRTLADDILTPEQMEQLDAMLAELKEGGADAVRTAIVERLAEALGLEPEQVEQAVPVLKGHFVRVADLVKQMVDSPDATRESLRAGLEAVRAETLAQLQTILTPEQMEALAGKLEDLRDKALEALPEAA